MCLCSPGLAQLDKFVIQDPASYLSMLTGECILTEAQAPRLHVPGTLSMGIQGNCQVNLLQILKSRPFLTGILERGEGCMTRIKVKVYPGVLA